VVWGCTYVPNYGGAFGQHAWNEIYMGEAGWIPVDSTAFEIDFVDSGHIRLGELASVGISLNAERMEVLNHRLASKGDAADAGKRYEAFLGEYSRVGRGKVMVEVSGGGLAVDIPGRLSLALREPDGEGRWFAKLSNLLYCTFGRDEAGRVNELAIHQIIRLPRRSTPKEIDESVPTELRRYLGGYLLPTAGAVFEVICREGSLAVKDPMAKKTIGLRRPDEKGRWVDEFGRNSMTFEEDEEGKVTTMVIDAVGRYRR
jgi:hypothetical protein